MLEINIFFFKSYSQLSSSNRPFMYPSLYLQARAKWADFCLWLRMSGGWRGFVLSSPFSTACVPGHVWWELKLPVILGKSQIALSTFGTYMHFPKETQAAGTGPTKGGGSRALRCTSVGSQALLSPAKGLRQAFGLPKLLKTGATNQPSGQGAT